VLKIYVKGKVSSVKVKSGLYIVLLEYKQLKKEINGTKTDTTKNEIELYAILEGLKSLTNSGKTKAITIITENHYINRGINELLKTWQKNNWQSAKGQEIKNKELWQEIWTDYIRINPMIKAKFGTMEEKNEN